MESKQGRRHSDLLHFEAAMAQPVEMTSLV